MGTGQSNQQWVDQIPVPTSMKSYPPPHPPSFLLSDLVKNYKLRDTGNSDNKEGNIDWTQVREITSRSIDDQAAIENGKLAPTGNAADHTDEGQEVVNEKAGSKDLVNGKGNDTGNEVKQTDDEINQQIQADINGRHIKRSNKISFDEIDQHAREALPHHGETFKSLVGYISKKIPGANYRDVFLVRGITAWFCNRNIEGLKPVTASLASPDGLVQHVRNKSLSFTSSYALLIRSVDIPCVIISGWEKGGQYTPGDSVRDLFEGHWCAVYVDKSWQLIHPLWACRGTYTAGREKENLVLIEDDSQAAMDISEVLDGLQRPKQPAIKHIINADYFMPKPDVFKYKCHPHEQKWSLTPKKIAVNIDEEISEKSIIDAREQFRVLPFLSPSFFKLSLQLVSSPYNDLITDTGKVTIEIGLIPELTRKVFFRHKLAVKDVDHPSDERLQSENISRLVLYHRCNDMAVFEIALPSKGTYLFKISGGIKGNVYNLCKFQLTSTENHDIPLLPLDAGLDGWGPGPKSQKAGLLVPSRPKGVITYPSTMDDNTGKLQPSLISIRFDVSREFVANTEYSAEIRQSRDQGIDQSGEQFQTKTNGRKQNVRHHVSCTKDRLTRTLEIDVKVLHDGLYALIIRATQLEDRPMNRKAHKKGSTEDICYYLLNPSFGVTRQNPKIKFAHSELTRAVQAENHKDMATAVERCLLLGLDPTNEDVASVQVRMEYIKLKNDINDCIKRRNLSVLNDTLKRVLKYRYRAALVEEVEELLDFRKKILAIDGYQLYLPTIREASEELYKMPHIRPEVHNTMQAVLLILQHPLDRLDWPYVKSQLRVTGERPGRLVKQLEMYDSSPSPPDMMCIRKAEQVLYRYTFPQVLHVNHSLATFYKWAEAIVLRMKEFERMQREYEQRQAEMELKKVEIRRVKQEKKAKKKYKRQHRSF